MLTEPAFVEEFDTIVDEITDQYVRGEFKGGELKQLERYFLKARERQVKARIASALMKHAAATRPENPAPVNAPTLIERLLAFFSPQSVAFKFASTAAVVLLVVGLLWVRGPFGSPTLAQIELSISDSDRAERPEPKSLKLAPGDDGARIVLNLPQEGKRYQSYRVELLTRDGVSRPLEVPEQNSQTVTATADASLLKRGSYAIQLIGVNADGTEQRLRDTYYFNVQ